MIIVWLLISLLLFLAVLLALIILVPYEYELYGEKLETAFVRGSASWLFGGLKIEFQAGLGTENRALVSFLGLKKLLSFNQTKDGKENKTPAPKDKRQKKKSFGQFLKPEIIKEALSAFLHILNRFKPNRLSIDARAGFEDPFYTGLLYMLKGICFNLFDGYHVRIDPVFDEDVLEGRFLIGGRIELSYLIASVIGFLTCKPLRAMLIHKLKNIIRGGSKYAEQF